MRRTALLAVALVAGTTMLLSSGRAAAAPITLTFKTLDPPPNDLVGTVLPGAVVRITVSNATDVARLTTIAQGNVTLNRATTTATVDIPAALNISALAIRVDHINAAAVGNVQLQPVTLTGIFNSPQNIDVVMPRDMGTPPDCCEVYHPVVTGHAAKHHFFRRR